MTNSFMLRRGEDEHERAHAPKETVETGKMGFMP